MFGIQFGVPYRGIRDEHRFQVVYLRTQPNVWTKGAAWLDPWPLDPGMVTWPTRRRRKRRTARR